MDIRKRGTNNLDADLPETATRFLSMKARLLIIAAISALVVAAHAPVLRAGFVWDDTALVLRDPLIRSWRLVPEGLQHFLFVDATPSNFFRPLQRLSYTLEYWAFAFRPSPYHATNILLHLAATAALFGFALALLELYNLSPKARLVLGSLVAGAWAIHPVHSAVVDYISGRADALAALFGFAGLYLGIRALSVKGRSGWILHTFAGTAFLAAALSKESGLIFLGIWIALLLLRRTTQAFIPAGVAVAFVLTIYVTLRLQTESVSVPQLAPPAPLLVRPIIAARALAEYTSLILLPVNLHVERDVETHPWGFDPASLSATAWRELQTLAGIVLFALLLVWAIRTRKREPLVFTLLIFAGIAYLPVSGLVPLNATIAEHWIYVPSAFIMLAFAAQISSPTGHRAQRGQAAAIMIAVVWMGFLGLRTFFRAQEWKNQRIFLERTIAAGGDSARMMINLAGVEITTGNFDRAGKLLSNALAKEPRQPLAMLNLAAVELHKKNFSRARNLINEALMHPISAARAQEMLAMLEHEESQKIDLIRLRLAARIAPPAWSVERHYVRALGATGRSEEAIAELRAILITDWYRAESWQLLQEYLAKLGRTGEAEQALHCAYAYDVHLRKH